MVRECGIRVTILSSGLLLARHSAALAANADDVIVSLDGPAEVHDAIRGVPRAYSMLAEGIAAIRRHAPAFPIAARCTVQSRNAAHLCDTVDAARSLRLDSLSFLAADLASQAFHRPAPWSSERQSVVAPELAALEAEIERLAEYPAARGFVRESAEKLRRIAAHFRAHYGLQAATAPRCNAPWVSAVIEHTGDVRPCFFHPAIGNTSQGTLREILNSPRATAFRDSLDIATNPTCRRCVCSLYHSN
jgi:MoaA/NifB/PqqE/SkfB family radical SAM enzyme